MKFKRSVAPFAVLALCATALTFVLVTGDAHAGLLHSHNPWVYGAEFALATGLDSLRTQHAELVRMASAKIAEVKDGMAKDAIAKIEGEHRELLANAEKVAEAIKVEEKKPTIGDKVKQWAAGFYASAGSLGIELKALNDIVASSDTHDQAKDKLIDALAKAKNGDKPAPNGGHVTVGMEEGQKFVMGATKSLIAKIAMFNPPGKPSADGEHNEFSGLMLREVARMSLDRAGVKNIARDPMAMIAQALQPVYMAGAHSTSDFTNILANVANKSMLKGYEEAAETFQLWTASGTLTDFKTATRVDTGLFPSLAEVEEGAEYTYASMSDRKAQLVLATYGKMFSITRQAIINDDLNAFSKVPAKMGTAAKRTIANLVWAIITGNANAPDNVALFHASHSNLDSGGGTALSADSLDAGRVKMAKQKDPDSIAKTGLGIRPAYLLVPVALQGKAHQLMTSQAEPGQDNPNVANRVANMAQVIADQRLDDASATAWYLAANQSQYDTIEVSYLNGVQAPTMEQRDGWNVDGVEFKVRIDAGVTLLDFRGFYKAAGA